MTLWETRYALICALSWASLLLERLWRSYWPAFSLVFAFTGLACLGVVTFFGDIAHLVMLAGFGFGALYFFVRPAYPFRMPRTRDVRRAVERQSGLSHRPLEAMTDHPAAGTAPEAALLWDKYQKRLRRTLDRLKIHRPAAGVASRDRYALRHGALLLLVMGLFVAQGDSGYRLFNAVSVDTGKWVRHTPVALDVWITPPEYTGVSPVFLATTQLGTTPTQGNIRVPENSVLKIRVSGFSDAPDMTFDHDTPAFTKAAARSYALEMKLSHGGTLKLKQGFFRTLGEWPVYVTPDAPPEITVLGTEKTQQGALKINYMTKDDYAVKTLTGTITPSAEIQRALGAAPVDFNVPVSTNDNNVFSHVEDLTAHPFAGSTVTLTMTATDDAGNSTTSAPVTLLLPERVFNNPVARRIAAERKRLIWYNNALTRFIVMGNLANIANDFDGYHYDNRVFLGLDVAVKRLIYEGHDQAAVNSLIPLLWNVALRVEDGGLSMASHDLSDALQRLSDALKNKDISKGELQELMNDVRQKMRQYVKTLSAEMRQQMQDGKDFPALSPELAKKFMKNIDMGKMLQEMQQLSQGGEREQMQKMAEYLKRSVDNLDLNRMEQMKQAQRDEIQAMNDLQKLIDRQQSLLDQTNKMPQRPQPQQARQQGDKQQPQAQQSPQQQDNGQPKNGGRQQGEKQQDKQQAQGAPKKQGDSGPEKQQQGGQQQSAQTGQPGKMPPQPDSAAPYSGQNDTSQQNNGQQNNDQQGGQQQSAQQQQGGTQQGQDQQGQNGPPQPQPQMGQNGMPMPEQNGMPMPMPGQQGQKMPAAQGAGQGQGHSQGVGHQGQGHQGMAQGTTQGAGSSGSDSGTNSGDDTPPDNIDTPKEGAQEQGTIRGKLGDIMRKLGGGLPQIPENFAKSDQAMEQSQRALSSGAPRDSAPAQQEALSQLQQGLDKSLQQMAQQMQAVMSFGGGGEGPNGNYGEGFDPLGRQTDQNGKVGEQDIQLPDGKEQRRVQQIIQELRDRSNDYNRPKVERDYIERLLDQFN